MRNLEPYFNNRKICFDKLEKLDFRKENNYFVYEEKIHNKEFIVQIILSKTTKTSKLIEIETKEDYVLVDIDKAKGNFISKLKIEYEKVLEKTIERCSVSQIFKGRDVENIIDYINRTYKDSLEFLWKKFSNNAVVRRKDNKKWYLLFGIIEKKKLGLDSNKLVDILVLRYPKEKRNEIINGKNILPGYHMNKENWITIILDTEIDIETIYHFISISYELAGRK